MLELQADPTVPGNFFFKDALIHVIGSYIAIMYHSIEEMKITEFSIFKSFIEYIEQSNSFC